MRGKGRARLRPEVAVLAMILTFLLAACGQTAPSSSTTTTTAGSAPIATTAAASVTTAPTTATESTAPATATLSTTPAAATTEATGLPAPAAPATATATAAPATATTQVTTAILETATTSATPAATGTAQSDVRPQFGVAAHLYYTDRARVLQLAQNGGFEWVRQQVPWKDTEKADRTFAFDELDQVIESVYAKQLKLLLSVAKSPDFLTGRKGDNGLPKDPKDFGRFVEELATRYKGKIQAIEVWNEQNLAVENGGRVVAEDAGRYVELLKEAYTRIKAVDPSIVVIAGALSSTGVTRPDTAVDDLTYLQNMYAYRNGEIKNFMDAQGFHPASALNPPEKLWPDDPGPGCQSNPKLWCDSRTHYFRHIEDVRNIMEQSGLANKKIWITEMGWATQNNTPGYEYGNSVSLQQQADYLERALARIVFQYNDWVGAVFIWNLNFAVLWGQQGNPLHEQAAFGLLNPDWSPRPSFTAVQGFIKAAKSSEQR